MNRSADWHDLPQAISATTGHKLASAPDEAVSGGYGSAFYSAYETAWPLEAGAAERVPLYNLYHVLNHFNLFGGGYRRQAEDMIERLLAEVG